MNTGEEDYTGAFGKIRFCSCWSLFKTELDCVVQAEPLICILSRQLARPISPGQKVYN